jgi:hypothetical protein
LFTLSTTQLWLHFVSSIDRALCHQNFTCHYHSLSLPLHTYRPFAQRHLRWRTRQPFFTIDMWIHIKRYFKIRSIVQSYQLAILMEQTEMLENNPHEVSYRNSLLSQKLVLRWLCCHNLYRFIYTTYCCSTENFSCRLPPTMCVNRSKQLASPLLRFKTLLLFSAKDQDTASVSLWHGVWEWTIRNGHTSALSSGKVRKRRTHARWYYRRW